MVAQFSDMIAKGGRYLQPSSRILALSLATLTWLVARHPNPAVAGTWQYYAAAVALLVPVAPYEIWAIFPFNDRIKEIGANMGEKRGEALSKKDEKELRGLLRQWQLRNIGRVIMPLAAALVLLWNVVGSQSI